MVSNSSGKDRGDERKKHKVRCTKEDKTREWLVKERRSPRKPRKRVD